MMSSLLTSTPDPPATTQLQRIIDLPPYTTLAVRCYSSYAAHFWHQICSWCAWSKSVICVSYDQRHNAKCRCCIAHFAMLSRECSLAFNRFLKLLKPPRELQRPVIFGHFSTSSTLCWWTMDSTYSWGHFLANIQQFQTFCYGRNYAYLNSSCVIYPWPDLMIWACQ